MSKKKLSDFSPQRKNANKHTQRGLGLLDDSMSKDGWIGAMTVAADGEAFDGSARLETAFTRFAGSDPIIVETDGTRPVIVKRTDIESAETPRARRLALAANRIAQVDLEWDTNILAEFVKDEPELLKGMWDDKELKEIIGSANPDDSIDAEPRIERADELQKEWKTEYGQLWQLGDHRLICGDCADTGTVEKILGGMKACLVFTDPPYGVSIAAKNRLLNTIQKSKRCLIDIKDDELSPDELKERLLPAFVNIRKIVMADDCTVFVTAPQGGDLGMMMMMMMQDAGLKPRHVLIWKKNAPTFSMGRLDYDYQHECILLTWGKKHKRPMNGQHRTSVWEIDKPRHSAEHPTMKPVELVVNAIMNNSDSGDMVFDPYCGSGTMILAAEQTGRIARAIEIEPRYVAVALQRYLDATGKRPELVESL